MSTETTKKITTTGSEAVLLSLIEEGVELIFGYPGGAIMPVYDSLMNHQEKLKHILAELRGKIFRTRFRNFEIFSAPVSNPPPHNLRLCPKLRTPCRG